MPLPAADLAAAVFPSAFAVTADSVRWDAANPVIARGTGAVQKWAFIGPDHQAESGQ